MLDVDDVITEGAAGAARDCQDQTQPQHVLK
jgi:hypothetical protein